MTLHSAEKAALQRFVRFFNLIDLYRLDEKKNLCIFCGQKLDCMSHYVVKCSRVRDWFTELDRNKKEI